MLRNSDRAWGTVARSLHWLVALLIFAQLVLGRVAEEAPLSPRKLDLFVWHKSIGLTILLLVLLRIAWRLTNPTPAPVAGTPPRFVTLAKLGHGMLYLLMVLVPLSGWIISDTSRIPFRAFWLVPVPDLLDAERAVSEMAERVHDVLTTALLAVVVVHIVAALIHHFRWRDDTLVRMLPVVRPRGAGKE